MSNFGKFFRNDGSFLEDDAYLDRVETIKFFGKSDTVIGLPFLVLDEKASISDQWRRGNHKLGIFM